LPVQVAIRSKVCTILDHSVPRIEGLNHVSTCFFVSLWSRDLVMAWTLLQADLYHNHNILINLPAEVPNGMYISRVAAQPTTSQLTNFQTYNPIKLTSISLVFWISGLVTQNLNIRPMPKFANNCPSPPSPIPKWQAMFCFPNSCEKQSQLGITNLLLV
jgi:hypothetical protein